jgi:hypothetical protein
MWSPTFATEKSREDGARSICFLLEFPRGWIKTGLQESMREPRLNDQDSDDPVFSRLLNQKGAYTSEICFERTIWQASPN